MVVSGKYPGITGKQFVRDNYDAVVAQVGVRATPKQMIEELQRAARKAGYRWSRANMRLGYYEELRRRLPAKTDNSTHNPVDPVARPSTVPAAVSPMARLDETITSTAHQLKEIATQLDGLHRKLRALAP